MRSLSRRVLYFLVYWLSLALLWQWPAAAVMADPGDEPTAAMPAELPTIPPMAFQPPPDAGSLSDFIPPGSVIITATVDLPGGAITPTIPITLPTPTVEPPISPTVPLPSPTTLPLSPTVPLLTPTLLPPVTPTTTFPHQRCRRR